MTYRNTETARLVYEAAISSLALEELRRQEGERPKARMDAAEVLRAALDCRTKYESLLAYLANEDFGSFSKNDIASLLPNFYSLIGRTTSFTEVARPHLRLLPTQFRTALHAVLNELDACAERILGAAEGWSLALDEQFTSRVKRAVVSVRTRPSRERRNWRDVLASVGD